MADLSIISVAIGLIFTYMILSVLTTSISTLINQIANTRARNLKEELKDFLGDDTFSNKFFTHPLINLLVPGTIPPLKENMEIRGVEQSRINETEPSEAQGNKNSDYRRYRRWHTVGCFAGGAIGTLLGALFHEPIVQSLSSVIGWLVGQHDALTWFTGEAIAGEFMGKLIGAFFGCLVVAAVGGTVVNIRYGRFFKNLSELFLTTRVENLKKEMFASAIESIVKAELDEKEVPRNPRLNFTLLSDPPKEAIVALVGMSDPDKLMKVKLEQWFEQYSRNSTAVFRRRQALLAFFVGLILAISINADTLQIVRALFEDNELRTNVSKFAQEYLDGLDSKPTPEATPDVAANDGQAQHVAFVVDMGAQDATPELPSNLINALADGLQTIDQLLTAGLPIGWEFTPISIPNVAGNCFSDVGRALRECENSRNLWLFWEGNTPHYGSLIFRKVIGIILTAIAVAQGAPFWFDLLNRLTGRKAPAQNNEDGSSA